LCRQHVKPQDSGINVSRAWITKLMPAAVSLIEPIFNAQLESVRRSRVIAMDETPIKAGRAGPGKMKAAYFWPIVGEQDEICFLYYPIRERRVGLSVYLDDPEVSIDTNHLERALRVIPMGKKNWLFSWTELGAKHIGIGQSLLATCRLHDINPYDYFVDVLQRVGQHPASLVHQLTPRIWKEMFAENPLRSDLHDLGCRRVYAVA
jgi:hypothetical protein